MSKIYNFIKPLTCFLFLSATTFGALAQIPAGYYDDASGKTGYELKTALFFTIDGHNERGYSALWDFYQIADVRPDGFVWDIYADCNFVFGTDQDNGSGGTTECDKYNREHTFPQSWFNELSVPRSDAVMVLPTDKKVNSERGNFPYGEVTNATYTSGNGSKKGANTLSGYSGTVFEPIDAYKGDLARIYFYMATRYQSQIDEWENNSTEANIVLNGTEDQVFEQWVLDMLISWHELDPVSQKEIDRNNDVYDFQGNRNPYVDHPEWVSCIWENSCGDQPVPQLSTSTNMLDFGTITFSNEPVTLQLEISGEALTGDLLITTAPSLFTVSESADGTFSESLTLSPDDSSEINKIIYVRFVPSENISTTINGTLNMSHPQIDDFNINLSAEVVQKVVNAQLSFTDAEITIDIEETQVFSVTISAQEKLQDSLSFQVRLSDFSNIFYPAQFTTNPAADGTLLNLSIPANDSTALIEFILDTAKLKNNTEKSFRLSIENSSIYQLGEVSEMTINVAPFGDAVTSNKPGSESMIKLYPNPASDFLVVRSAGSSIDYIIYNLHGKMVQSGKTADQRIVVKQLKEGIYYLQLQEKNIINHFKFIKQ